MASTKPATGHSGLGASWRGGRGRPPEADQAAVDECDGCPPEAGWAPQSLPSQEAGGRAGVRADQAGPRLPTVSDERARSGPGRMDDDLSGPQPAEAGTGRPVRPPIRAHRLRSRPSPTASSPLPDGLLDHSGRPDTALEAILASAPAFLYAYAIIILVQRLSGAS